MSKKVGIYARVSTDRQTTDAQLHELREFVRRTNWSVYREYIDNGYSGKIPKGPRTMKCSVTLATVDSICSLFGNLTDSRDR